MHRFSAFMLVLLWALALASTPSRATGSPTDPLIDSRILILGDSLSAAYNMPVDASWPALLQQRLEPRGLRIVNASISGETTEGGRRRLPALLQQHRPAVVILELGGNDGLRGFPFGRTRANLAAMIQQARAAGARVLLVGVRLPPNLGPVYNRRFQRIYRSLAEETGVALLPRFLEGVADAGDPSLMQTDGIHPTAKAQSLLAEKMAGALEPLLAQSH